MEDWFEKIPIDIPTRQPLNPKQIRNVISIIVVLAVVFLIFAFKPWFIVDADEMGVVLRLGKFNRVVKPGLHWRLPRPIEIVYTPAVQEVKRIEIGFKTVNPGPPARYLHLPEESEMLTGDENIVVSEMIVQYRITDPVKYLFNVYDSHSTLKDIAEASERQVIGDYAIDAAWTWGREEIEDAILQSIQTIADQYEIGVKILKVQLQDVHPPKPVESAFLAVQNAREEQSQIINEADAYRNSEIPKAEGDVKKILQEAEAYRAERIAKSKGEVERFSALLNEYQKAPEVTRTRLYLETLEKVLAGKPKVIIGSDQDLFKFFNMSPQGFSSGFQSKQNQEGR